MILHDVVLKFVSMANDNTNICSFSLFGHIKSSFKRMLVRCIVEDEGHVLINLEMLLTSFLSFV